MHCNYLIVLMPSDTANAFRSRETQILMQVSSFVRKQPQEKGCKQLLALAKETDLSYASLLISTANKYFAPIFYMWNKYERSLGKDITAFMNTLHSKIAHSKIIPLRSQFEFLKEKYQRASRRRVVLLKEAQVILEESDNKLKSLVAECQKIRNQSTREKRSLVVQHEDTEKVAPSLATINEDLGKNYQQTRIPVIRQLHFKIKLNYEKEQSRKVETRLVHKLQERPVVSRDCLNCLSFVYENEDLIFPCSKQPVSYFGRILSLSTMQRDILMQMISYLNGRGGVLLIGTQRVGNMIVPIVEEIAQFHKEQQENRLQAALSFIWPAVSLNKQIEHAFIPIAQNCRKNPQNTQPVWKGNGACILRITVNPTQPHKTYHYSIPTNTSNQPQADASLSNIPLPAAGLFNFYRHTELGVRQLKDEEIYQFMKDRYRQYDPSGRPVDFVLRDRGNYHPCLIHHIDRCQPAEKGNPFYGENSYYQDAEKKRENNLKSINPLLTPGLQSFKSITLLVVVSSLLERISNILTSEQKLQSKIVAAFKHIKAPQPFKLSNNTFLIFHNCKFEKLKNGINKQKPQLKAQNDKKEVILISTLAVLSLREEDMTTRIRNQLEEEVTKVAKEKLEFKFIEGVCYVKCPSNITAVYAYFYLHHHHNIRGKFEKIPQGSTSRSKQHKGTNVKKTKAAGNFDKPFNDRSGGGNREYDSGYYEKSAYRHKDYSYRERDEDEFYSDEEQNNDQYEEDYEASSSKRQNYYKKEQPYESSHYSASEYSPSHHRNYTSQAPSTADTSHQQHLSSYEETYSSERPPVLLSSQCDYTNGLRYDFYDNSIVYIYILSTGQYYSCQYYQMQPR